MKWIYIIGCILIAIIFYVLGNIVPYKIFIPSIDWSKNISSGEYYYYFITTLGTIATAAAVFVALFGEKIKQYISYPKFKIKLHSDDILAERSCQKSSKYYNYLEVHNKGNVCAQKCELFLEKIASKIDEEMKPCIHFEGCEQAYWDCDKKQKRVIIPNSGYRIHQLFSIGPNQDVSAPNGEGTLSNILLNISGKDIAYPSQSNHTIYTIDYLLSSVSCKPYRFTVEVRWDGKWEDLKDDMSQHIKTTIK